jgi:uncharacterized protein (TIGR02246 family)
MMWKSNPYDMINPVINVRETGFSLTCPIVQVPIYTVIELHGFMSPYGGGIPMSERKTETILEEWLNAWDDHDLDGVVGLFADDAIFETWTGMRISGRDKIREAWRSWFGAHGDFKFEREILFVSRSGDRAAFVWKYTGPSLDSGFAGESETRRGVDILRFENGEIKEKLTFSKTVFEVGGRRRILKP